MSVKRMSVIVTVFYNCLNVYAYMRVGVSTIFITHIVFVYNQLNTVYSMLNWNLPTASPDKGTMLQILK